MPDRAMSDQMIVIIVNKVHIIAKAGNEHVISLVMTHSNIAHHSFPDVTLALVK